jgi:hypothetical protein
MRRLGLAAVESRGGGAAIGSFVTLGAGNSSAVKVRLLMVFADWFLVHIRSPG